MNFEHKVIEVPNFLTKYEATKLWYVANEAPYYEGRVSNTFSRKVDQSRMTANLDAATYSTGELWRQIQDYVGESLTLHDIYINRSSTDEINLAHCDNNIHSLSILICLNQEWHRDWAGYTVFFDGMNSNEILKTVIPEPGKAIFFDSRIWHLALPVSKIAPVRRMMVLKIIYSGLKPPSV